MAVDLSSVCLYSTFCTHASIALHFGVWFLPTALVPEVVHYISIAKWFQLCTLHFTAKWG